MNDTLHNKESNDNTQAVTKQDEDFFNFSSDNENILDSVGTQNVNNATDANNANDDFMDFFGNNSASTMNNESLKVNDEQSFDSFNFEGMKEQTEEDFDFNMNLK
eukprot:CAMPEP_0116988892 /NCGR_PEP_ID=MMETSP0467-20121206/64453_1 /TAXON_ID=283647 /ORGANISM="Mesodinium pulex, Strain SPMC105" /LENGTH=104 /DNA_ID=CAMNT_0004685151 /DNA_START=1646 /DNA_END=1960 /DNA_ORIENTATION=-